MENQGQLSGRGPTVRCMFQKDHTHCHSENKFQRESLEAGRLAREPHGRRTGISNSDRDDGSCCRLLNAYSSKGLCPGGHILHFSSFK